MHCRRSKKKNASKDFRRKMQTYHRKDDIPNCDQCVLEEIADAQSDDDEGFLEEYLNRRRRIRKIRVSPATSLESMIVTALSMDDLAAGDQDYKQCGDEKIAGEMHDIITQSDDMYSMFGGGRYDGDGNSLLFGALSRVAKAIYTITEETTRSPLLLGLALLTLLMVILAIQIETFIAYLCEEVLNLAYPFVHGSLILVEQWLMGAASSVGAFNDMTQATYCDTVDRWCRQYEMMCEQKCSYSRIVAERVRGRP